MKIANIGSLDYWQGFMDCYKNISSSNGYTQNARKLERRIYDNLKVKNGDDKFQVDLHGNGIIFNQEELENLTKEKIDKLLRIGILNLDIDEWCLENIEG